MGRTPGQRFQPPPSPDIGTFAELFQFLHFFRENTTMDASRGIFQ